MGKLTVTAFLTLDGVMQAPGGPTEDPSGGFKYGGWLVPHFDDDTGRFMVEVFSRVDAFLLGRRTFQIFEGHWPRVTDPKDPIATALNKLPKYVVTKTLDRVEWSGSSIVRGGSDLVKEIEGLKARYPRELQVHGSIGLVQSLLEHDGLVDELNLLHFPVLLGSGKRLFTPSASPSALVHKETRTTGKGVVITTHARTGKKPETGSFELPKEE